MKAASRATRAILATALLLGGLVVTAGPAAACTLTVGECVSGDDGQTDDGGTSDGGDTGTTTSPTSSEPAASEPPPAPPAAVPDAEVRLLELVNHERVSRGVPALALHAQAASIARDHSFAMADAGTVFHNDSYFSASTRAALGASLLGENVAHNTDVDDAHARLMASPKHRDNILDPRFTGVGIGVVRVSTGRHYVTQAFLQAAGAPAPAPRPDPAATDAGPPASAPAGEPAPPADADMPTGDDDEPGVSVRAAKAGRAHPVRLELPDGGADRLFGIAPTAEWAGGLGFAAGMALLALALVSRRLLRRIAATTY